MRLIDADEVKHTFCDNCRLHVDIDCADDCEILKMIDEQPTIEAEPVVHGKWDRLGDRFTTYICSACENMASFRFDYCPNCGARMDEEETE